MSFADEFKEVERKAVVENTAQDVFNILKDLESQALLHASHWILEFLHIEKRGQLKFTNVEMYKRLFC